MFKKVLASVGIGSAKVDTQLDNNALVPGELVRGKSVIIGGNAEQTIDRINLFVMTEVIREKNDRKVHEKIIVDSVSVGNSFTIKAGEKKEIEFQFKLPIHTPPTIGKTRVWIQTGLDVPNAVDPKDRDFIKVNQHAYMKTILSALTDVLGFQLRKVEMEYSKRYRFVQEFEFKPRSEFRRDLDELEVMFFMKENEVELLLQIDRRVKGLGSLLSEALEMDESFVRVRFSNHDLDQGPAYIAEVLKSTISKYS